MYFDLTDEQSMLRDSLDSMLRDCLGDTRVMTAYDGNGALDRSLWTQLVQLGLPAIMVSAERGGAGLDLLTLAVAQQTLAYRGAAAPVSANALAAWLVDSRGSEEQRARWLAPLLQGEVIAAFAFDEGADEWLPARWTLEVDGAGRVAGRKNSVEWAHEAGLLIVGLAGCKLGLVDAKGPGISLVPQDTLDRTRPLFELTFDGAAIEALDAGPEATALLVDALLAILASDAFGAGKRALDMAVDYAKVRQQFGRTIGSFQGLKFQLATMASEIEPCQALTWYAAHAWDSIPEDRSRAVAIAKAHVTDVAVKTARAAVEAHGGIGYTWEYPLHVWLKRAMHDRATLGVPLLHRERAAELAGWRGNGA